MGQIEIRFSQKSDLAQLPWLYRQYYNGDTKVETDTAQMLKKFRQLSKDQNYRFISAMDGDQLVGFCYIVLNQDIVGAQKPMVTLWHLRVHPSYRGQKIGQRIVYFVESFARSVNAQAIYLICEQGNQGARRFYQRLDFIENYGFTKNL